MGYKLFLGYVRNLPELTGEPLYKSCKKCIKYLDICRYSPYLNSKSNFSIAVHCISV